jgi:hypothetical protein
VERHSLRLLLTGNGNRVSRALQEAPIEAIAEPTVPLAATLIDEGRLGAVSGEALTARELELLRDLPSLLDEIAEAQVVSVKTVKTTSRPCIGSWT